MRGFATLLIAAAVVMSGCGPSGPSPAVPSTLPTPPAVASGTGSVVSGVVIDSNTKLPLAGARVFLVSGRGGWTTTDARGLFQYTGVPDGFIVLQAGKTGYEQRCAVTAQLHGDAVLDVELVPVGSPMLTANADPPTLSGVVFETTPVGRRPVAGALVGLGGDNDYWLAGATTDAEGRYLLCRLPVGYSTHVWASKTGYAATDVNVQIVGSGQRDLEMSR